MNNEAVFKKYKNVIFNSVNIEFWRCENFRVFNLLSIALLALSLFSCAGQRAPSYSLEQPPNRKIHHHTVSRGETLYAIAWRYNKDFNKLAQINGISKPYRIFPGQRLRLRGGPSSATLSKGGGKSKTETFTVSKTKKSLISARPAKKPLHSAQASVRWRWPVKGKLIGRFEAQNPLRKGIDIAGKKREAVYAAADGVVIYAGNALRGYGNLLIVKHNDQFLSAYAHNYRLIVDEGVSVKGGQHIAEMGSTGTSRDMLHFEIRRNGQPVNPLEYLP